ncbi:DNA polymerase III subunit epsilon [Leucothrix pacifica]|uniref:DNA polymerase III subunit epsilon n=1 Tax=Leucothrix pacifica TaxID=1247513 RepID=A0A317CL91_9GAMM|nr:DNA polymerase III subunit epsilon [Leucothrix pacifica]PWQ99298.1 DNA polymerase III subunit epsilon [Leucothrix pacifica]
MARQIIMDTETTGIEIKAGNKIIEIGCVEMIDRKFTGHNYHQYLNADRDSEEGALKVHGITTEFLADKPRFHEVVADFIDYIKGAELIIHNAPFDIGFLNHELSLVDASWGKIEDICTIIDSLVMARDMFPSQRNSLDALCKRFDINNSHRELHGALLDSEILGDVYLAMTGGQVTLSLDTKAAKTTETEESEVVGSISLPTDALRVISANADELQAHNERMEAIVKQSGKTLWQ